MTAYPPLPRRPSPTCRSSWSMTGRRTPARRSPPARAAADPRFTLVRVAQRRPRPRPQPRASSWPPGPTWPSSTATTSCRRTPTSACCTRWRRPGSDFVSGNVQRIGPLGITQSALHAKAIKGRRTGPTSARRPPLFYDVSVWNKLFRRSFWDRARADLPRGHGLGGHPGHDPGPRAGLGRGRDSRLDLLLARAEHGRAVDHPVPHRHQQLHRPHHRAAGHRRVPARPPARPGWSASTSTRRWSTTSGCTSASWAGRPTASGPSSCG